MGRSTRAIADSTPGCVYAVDTWAGPDTEEINRQLKGKPASRLKDEFLNNIGEEVTRPAAVQSAPGADDFVTSRRAVCLAVHLPTSASASGAHVVRHDFY